MAHLPHNKRRVIAHLLLSHVFTITPENQRVLAAVNWHQAKSIARLHSVLRAATFPAPDRIRIIGTWPHLRIPHYAYLPKKFKETYDCHVAVLRDWRYLNPGDLSVGHSAYTYAVAVWERFGYGETASDCVAMFINGRLHGRVKVTSAARGLNAWATFNEGLMDGEARIEDGDVPPHTREPVFSATAIGGRNFTGYYIDKCGVWTRHQVPMPAPLVPQWMGLNSVKHLINRSHPFEARLDADGLAHGEATVFFNLASTQFRQEAFRNRLSNRAALTFSHGKLHGPASIRSAIKIDISVGCSFHEGAPFGKATWYLGPGMRVHGRYLGYGGKPPNPGPPTTPFVYDEEPQSNNWETRRIFMENDISPFTLHVDVQREILSRIGVASVNTFLQLIFPQTQ